MICIHFFEHNDLVNLILILKQSITTYCLLKNREYIWPGIQDKWLMSLYSFPFLFYYYYQCD